MKEIATCRNAEAACHFWKPSHAWPSGSTNMYRLAGALYVSPGLYKWVGQSWSNFFKYNAFMHVLQSCYAIVAHEQRI